MRKLNNKGITTIEVLICFVLIVIITVSIYATVSSFNEKKILEGYREQIINYKNLLTQDIQNDLIKGGLTHARYEKTNSGEKVIHTVYLDLKDGTERELVIEQLQAASSYHIGGSVTEDDYYMIKYGTPGDLIERDLPNVGHSGYNGITRQTCDADAPDRHADCRMIQDFGINNVYINITDDNVLSIYIGFYHPEFITRYAINIVCPIDYVSSGYDSTSNWTY
ncbi:MAG: hypothetical protein IK137_00800 [Bacilli bacterium]|nr:hypothetical protein [Bacilli bacterium]